MVPPAHGTVHGGACGLKGLPRGAELLLAHEEGVVGSRERVLDDTGIPWSQVGPANEADPRLAAFHQSHLSQALHQMHPEHSHVETLGRGQVRYVEGEVVEAFEVQAHHPSRRAVMIGSLAARMAGINPPTSPITRAKAIAVARIGGVARKCQVTSVKVAKLVVEKVRR